eukprot:3906283-Amphidinium_carterae.1
MAYWRACSYRVSGGTAIPVHGFHFSGAEFEFRVATPGLVTSDNPWKKLIQWPKMTLCRGFVVLCNVVGLTCTPALSTALV